MSAKIRIEVIDGVEGKSLYVNDYRVAGPKPWGGGKVVESWRVESESLRDAVEQVPKRGDAAESAGPSKCDRAMSAPERLRAALEGVIQRLESHDDECCGLDARDRNAIREARAALAAEAAPELERPADVSTEDWRPI